MQKLVLTGGPSGGKTTVAQALVREMSEQVFIVPEAASILYAGGWPRRKNIDGVRFQQKAIYFVQREVEELLASENRDRLLICDRGSLDGLAYWPDRSHPEVYLEAVATNVEREVLRYDWVLHLDTAPSGGYDLENPLRAETYSEASQLNERIRDAWKAHPKRFIVEASANGSFSEKLQRALFIVREILNKKSYEEILQALKTRNPS